MSESRPADGVVWVPWLVVPESGFEVARPPGSPLTPCGVSVVQINERQFDVRTAFRYTDDKVQKYLIDKLVARGMTQEEAQNAVDDARTFTPPKENPTDLASVPQYLRWFENSYGKHSLAALIHDELITDKANTGSLRSDTLSDRFFREMMRTSGVPWLKRWIMWSAVALRTRFVVGGWRGYTRWSVIGWLALSVVGIACAVGPVASLAFDWPWSWPWSPSSWPLSPWWTLVVAFVLIPVGGLLWGRQWGASLVSAVAAFWLVPAALVAFLAWIVYLDLEQEARGASKLRRR
ncbi:DUF1353 domain-containing protein [Aldersonia kunmingensis]|uniref:DUF1353 domain-containing protein n=1 Tax=Aldersonia kunmingensis TaxID=408066 RepID=UPI00082A7B04|nr:DUF1353 domain-containing protein [Aldersonia kunmingensis]